MRWRSSERSAVPTHLGVRGGAGYVLLLALLAAGLGLTVAAGAFAISQSGSRVATVDHRAERAAALADSAVLDVADRLVWGHLPAAWEGTNEAEVEVGGAEGTAHVIVQAARLEEEGRIFEVDAEARVDGAVSRRRLTVRAAPVRLPSGLTVAGDLTVSAPLALIGCGAYVNGDVLGREHIAIDGAAPTDGGRSGSAPGSLTEPIDYVRAAEWPTAAVHAGGRIYAAGAEVHAAGTAFPHDTDMCIGGHPAPARGWPPDRECWAGLLANADGGLFDACVLTLDLGGLAAALADATFPAPSTGPVVVVEPHGGVLSLTGQWPLDGGGPQMTLVVRGDCVLGGRDVAARATALRGALLVDGTLTVTAPSVVLGSIAADEMRVEADLSVIVTSDWRSSPPPGTLVAVAAAAVAAPLGRPAKRMPPPWAARRRSVAADTEPVGEDRRRYGCAVLRGRRHDMNDLLRDGEGHHRSGLPGRARTWNGCLKPDLRPADDTAVWTRGRGERGIRVEYGPNRS